MGYFRDLREHIAALDKAGLLIKIDEQINKDTELMPLVRWQFRGLVGRTTARVHVYQRRRCEGA